MAIDDEEAVFGRPKPKAVVHVLGEPLDALSAEELAIRIDAMKGEIGRLERAIEARAATRQAAAAFFKS